ncbi:MAG: VgrG-related protein [Actinomycetales bacterium]
MPATSSFLVEIGGAPLPADLLPLLVDAEVDDTQQLPDRFMLRFRDDGRIVVDKSRATVGASVKISVLTGESPTPAALIEGEITALEAEFAGAGSFTVIRGYDPAHRLFRARRTQAYTQMTASDIATKVAQRAGLRIGTVEPTTTVFEHVGQFGCTDWEFLHRLARESGREVSVREGAFSFTAPTQAATAPATDGQPLTQPLALHVGTDLLRARSVVTSAQQVTQVEVRGWSVENKEALVATADARTSTVELTDLTPAGLAQAFGSERYVATDTPLGTQAEVDATAAALGEAVSSAFAELEAVARGNPQLRAGTAASITGLGTPFDGKYTITASRHRLDPTSGYTTTIRVCGQQDRSLFALAGGQPASTREPGVVTALVTDIHDPQNLGRVKVSMPWLSQDYTSSWARTVQPGAGADRGLLVLPEVGDEVLVAFEQGDNRKPFVIGGLYNGVDVPHRHDPDPVDSGVGAVTRRSFVSRRGHRIDLLDQDGQCEGILLDAGDGALTLRMDAVETAITVHADGHILLEGKKGVTVNADTANLELSAQKVSLKATAGVEIDGGSGPVSVTTNAALDLKGSMATLQGQSATEVKGGGTCSISAPMVRIN